MKKFLSYFLIVFGITAIVAYMAWFPSELESSYRQQFIIGQKGSADGQFSQPTDVAITGDRVYICDTGNARIQVFNTSGEYLHQFGANGANNHRLQRPVALSLFNDRVYVADAADSSIKLFTLQGEFIARLADEALKQIDFQSPMGMDLDKAGNIVVTHAAANRVVKLSSEAKYLHHWGTGSSGTDAGQFHSPSDLVINQQGLLYIADSLNKRVQVMDDQGAFYFKWGGPFAMNIGGGFNGWFRKVSGITVGLQDNIYVADPDNNRIQKFMSNGTFLNSIQLESADYTHLALAVTDNGKLFAVDMAHHRVLVWSPPGA